MTAPQYTQKVAHDDQNNVDTDADGPEISHVAIDINGLAIEYVDVEEQAQTGVKDCF